MKEVDPTEVKLERKENLMKGIEITKMKISMSKEEEVYVEEEEAEELLNLTEEMRTEKLQEMTRMVTIKSDQEVDKEAVHATQMMERLIISHEEKTEEEVEKETMNAITDNLNKNNLYPMMMKTPLLNKKLILWTVWHHNTVKSSKDWSM